MDEYAVKLPLDRTEIRKYTIGDVLYLTGPLLTARDAAHERFRACVRDGRPLPVEIQGETIFYAGPCPTRPGRTMGSIAPTTSYRIDQFVEMMFQLGQVAMIGKGDRSPYVADLCRTYGGLYLLSIGGASALISNQVKSCDVIAYEDLGTESVKRLQVESLRVVVGIDTRGDVFQEREIARYRRI